MASASSGIRRGIADQRGVTLPELLVAMTISLLVAAGGMVMLQAAVRSQPQVSQQADQIQQGRALLETISRELRQGESIEDASATALQIMTYVNSTTCGGPAADTAILCQVTYSCEGASCMRTAHADEGEGSVTQVVTGLLEPEIFSYCSRAGGGVTCDLETAANPTYVSIELSYPGRDGERGITLADGVALRNHFDPTPG